MAAAAATVSSLSDELKVEQDVNKNKAAQASQEAAAIISGNKSAQETAVVAPQTPKSPLNDASLRSATATSRSYRFNRQDEAQAHSIISISHALVKEKLEKPLEVERDLPKLGEMVSELIHLLAAAGIGRNTAARAIAYMHGPDKLDPSKALIEAKKDRRRKNDRRLASGGSYKSSDKTDSITINTKTTSTDNSGEHRDGVSINAQAVNENVDDNGSLNETIKAVEATQDVSGNKPDMDQGNITESGNNAAGIASTDSKSKNTMRKKPFRPRKWWNSKRGQRSVGKVKEDKVRDDAAPNVGGEKGLPKANTPPQDPAAKENDPVSTPTTNGAAAPAA